MTENNDCDLLALTAQIVGAYVEKNSVPVADLPRLIGQVSNSISNLGAPAAPVDQKPAVSIKRSVKRDYIVCLEDGKRFKSMKRHLSAEHGLTAQEYREKWNLPSNYPMAAPSYAEARAEVARAMGLGRKRGKLMKRRVK